MPFSVCSHLQTYPKHNIPYSCQETRGITTTDLECASSKDDKKNTFQCEGCGKFFRWPHLMRRHFAAVHLKLKPHKCKKCELSFSRAEELRQHEASHTGSRNYKCNICSKTFRQNASLFVHQKSHTGIQFVEIASIVYN